MARQGLPLALALEWESFKFWGCKRWQTDRNQSERKALADTWVNALHRGGLDERAAVDLIGRVGRATGETALEVVDVSEIPTDRSRRNEWRRSTNGGPIIIPEEDIAA